MKGRKCFGLLLVLFTTLLSLSSVYSDANAIDFDEAGSANITGCSMTVVSTTVFGTPTSPQGGCIFMTPQVSGLANTLRIDLSTPIPGKSLVSVSGRYANDANINFIGLPGSASLIPISSSFSINEGQNQLPFQYVFYTPAPLNTLVFSGELWFVNSGKVRIDLNTIQFATLTNEPTRAQLQQIITTLGTYNQNLSNINTNVDNIWQYLQDKEDQDEEDRDNIEQQSTDNQDAADDAGNEADQAGQTLLQAFGSLITALTSVHETSCTLPNMSVYSLNLNNIDLCAVSLPSGVAALVSIGMVLIIVPLGIHLVKKMISLYKEITG